MVLPHGLLDDGPSFRRTPPTVEGRQAHMSQARPPGPTRAVVLGGSIAGMLAAAAVKDHVDHVEIVEAHDLPDGPEPRTGVPRPPTSTCCRRAGSRRSRRCCPAGPTHSSPRA